MLFEEENHWSIALMADQDMGKGFMIEWYLVGTLIKEQFIRASQL